ncbi:cathepsin D [Malassezia caprae]|uniref:Cathepsin D n=1 Tax=Malassezia caprae TaxID=1381934 RepID=A0AAF0IY65_9BASI|nr:cathepsin D [Malassezia caprae]
MKLLAALVAGLFATSAVSASTKNDNEIQLTRRNMFIKADDELDVKALSRYFNNMNRKYKHMMRNYHKNTGKQHPLLRFLSDLLDDDKEKRGVTNLPLNDISNEQLWAGEVSFGGQSFLIDFDTGSADVIVNPDAYDPHKSKSSKSSGQSFETSYGDGTTAKGTIYTDDFKIGPISGKNVAVGRSTQTFIEKEGGNQGIAGMSFASLSAFHGDFKPFFYSLMDQKQVSHGVFQFTLKKGEGSTLTLGAVDTSKYSGDPAWSNVDSDQGFWATGASVNGVKINAIVDTGSTILTGPMDQVRQVFSKIDGLKTFTQQGQLFATYDCNTTPDITVNIAGKDFKFSKEQTGYGKQGGRCVLTICGQDQLPMNAWIVGDSFFLGASVIFDMEQKRLGFAPQK